MHFLTDAVVWILSGYLALTSTLATSIENLLPPVEVHESTPQAQVTESDIATLHSDYNSIPDILLNSAAYQNASVIGSTTSMPAPATEVTDALVNIYCTYTTETYRRINTGTGFFIDPKGVILTNAHVAQFLLLEAVTGEGKTECILRSGDPATPLYEVDLLYISPAWVQRHAHLITNNAPSGTGERDFALLYVTAGLDNRPMPQYFPYLRTNTSLLTRKTIGSTVTAAGYPATELTISDGNAVLRPQKDTTTVVDLFTFRENTADVIKIDDSSVGVYGISGGPIIDQNNNVIGLISTKGNSDVNSTALRGISLAYIDRTIQEESTFDLARTMSGRIELRGQLFTSTIAAFLSKVLGSELQ